MFAFMVSRAASARAGPLAPTTHPKIARRTSLRRADGRVFDMGLRDGAQFFPPSYLASRENWHQTLRRRFSRSELTSEGRRASPRGPAPRPSGSGGPHVATTLGFRQTRWLAPPGALEEWR